VPAEDRPSRPGRSKADGETEPEASPAPEPEPTPAPEPEPEPKPVAEVPAAPEPTPPPEAAASQPPALDGFPTREAITLAWGDKVLDGLPTKVRNRFQTGRFIEVDEQVAAYAVDSPKLAERCEQVRSDVEAALTTHFGQPIPVRVVVEAAGARGPSSGGPAPGSSSSPPAGRNDGPSEAAPSTPAAPEPAEEDAIDPSELTDASDAATSGLDLLTEAFPGAEVLDDDVETP